MRVFRLPLVNAVAIAVLIPAAAIAQEIEPSHYAQLTGRHIGPVGNRVSTVVGVAGDRMTYYGGAASGGVWKTSDGGLTWAPIFDDQDFPSIGAIAVAESDPNVVWVGTGEAFIRSNVSIGNGVFRSTDGGNTWEHKGLDGSGRIGRIIVHPSDPDVAYAAVLGHGYSPQPGRGVFRTTDGGVTWEHVLAVDEETGASDIVMDPNNPRILFAGMWQMELRTWTRESGGPGSGLYMTRDGGDTWKRLEGSGLPRLSVGKVAVCMTPENSNRIYALIETGDGVPWHGQETESGELWRSDNGGGSWRLVSHNRSLTGRSAYYSRCAVAPDDPDEAYFMAAGLEYTKDGGSTFESASFFGPQGGGFTVPGYDHHDMWIDPTNADRMIVGHDGGVSISENRGLTWLRVQLPVAQMYHVTADNQIPYYVMGNRQDGPSMRGPSNSRAGGFMGGGIPRGAWQDVGGGESGFATPDPEDPNIVWSSASGFGALGGVVVRWDARTEQFRQIEVWPEYTVGVPAADVRYRFQWTFPLLISPHDNNTVFVTSQHVHRTTNGGQSWEVISPDLTRNDSTQMGISGGLTPDNLGVEYCCVVYAFEESPVQQGVYWAGSSDGLVHVSQDGGDSWDNVTANIPDLPPLGTVRNIDASKWDAGKAYMTIDFHEVGDFAPYVYKTENFGGSWTKITDGIADGPVSYARNIREDPVRPGLLYLGTENALYVSFDDGEQWKPFRNNIPPAPMYWLVVQEHFNDLVIGTYGRGFWIVDDITPLQQLTDEVAASDVHLFQPRNAYRFKPISTRMAAFYDPSAGTDPPYGASINYWLREKPEGEVQLSIVDAAGDTVRTLSGTNESGINRLMWDLNGEPSTEIVMRTKPLHAEWFDLGDDRRRSSFQEQFSVMAPPGRYTVHLQVNGETLSQPLEVLKDPNSSGTVEDIRVQTAMLEEVREDMNAAAETINRIELLRRQLEDLKDVVSDRDDSEELGAAADSLIDALVAVEENLLQLRVTGTGQDYVRWPSKLVERLGYLGMSTAIGDFVPTDPSRAVHTVLQQELAEQQAALAELLRTQVEAFNRMLREREVPQLISQQAGSLESSL
jgi:photosystem II stability/assembly factor-like uncharacterized protein